MRKFVIWLKINWLKILLIIIFLSVLGCVAVYVKYIAGSYSTLEPFTKRQMAGTMAMYMPMFIFAQLLTLPFIFAMYYYIMRGGGTGTFKRGNLHAQKADVRWHDVVGMKDAREDAMEVVRLLKEHSLKGGAGGHTIKGTLMIGPPGCGKTYLAKAIATECDLPMISAVGSDFVAMFMGQGAARMKSMFKQAREEAKIHGGCIIFIDEIDAFARPRAGDPITGFGGANVSHNATINQFLTEMDGLGKSDTNIIIIAATNINEEELDPAIMRSGRFDRKIRVEKPSAADRAELLSYYLAKTNHDPSIDINHYADKTKWFSASDINNAVKEASVIAARGGAAVIRPQDLDAAIKRLMISLEKTGGDKILSDRTHVKWDDVIGMKDVKTESWEIVEMLKDRHMTKRTGGKIIKGMVMFGPPGCGKTYLAKAIATESGLPLIPVSGSELVGIIVGEGAKRMKNIFEEARKLARAEGGCIIFFDEIDSFARHRVGVTGWGGGISHNATINQFLTELDGLRQQENTIVVIAATNAKEGELDPAILRAGRLERKIHFNLPTLEDRKELFKYYFTKIDTADDVVADRWARIAVGTSPADIENIIREAGLLAWRSKRDAVTHKDLMQAYDRITLGAETRETYSKKSILKTAYHEAGHAIMTYLVHPTDEVIKATIKPRKGMLGSVAFRPIEELTESSPNKEHLLAMIQVGLAGYVAEKLGMGTTASGVGGGPGSDFHKCTQIAHAMVWCLGMGSSQLIGDFTALKADHISEKTREVLDADVQEILQSCLQQTTKTLTANRALLDHFAQELMEKGDLEYDDVQAIFTKFNVNPAARSIQNPPDDVSSTLNPPERGDNVS